MATRKYAKKGKQKTLGKHRRKFSKKGNKGNKKKLSRKNLDRKGNKNKRSLKGGGGFSIFKNSHKDVYDILIREKNKNIQDLTKDDFRITRDESIINKTIREDNAILDIALNDLAKNRSYGKKSIYEIIDVLKKNAMLKYLNLQEEYTIDINRNPGQGLGMGLGFEGDSVVVVRVDPGTPAGVANLQEADVILSVNGKQLTPYNWEKRFPSKMNKFKLEVVRTEESWTEQMSA
jgi:predicted metalloprotease with PDZ domain